MFARIAPRYDLLNRLLSAGVDRRWREALVERLGELAGTSRAAPASRLSGHILVDSCSGTGDLALALQRRGARVIGVDFTPEMLVRARAKVRGRAAVFVGGDALRLPIATRAADAASIAFGIRNVADRERGLQELARVVRPGGWVLVLEFSSPRGFLAPLYRLYFQHVLPRIGGWVSGDSRAYRYLPETVLRWPSPEELRSQMQAVGLADCSFSLLTGGIACLSWGRVPARHADAGG